MKKQILINSLLAIAASNPDGFTVNAETLQPIKSGFACACIETQNSFGVSGVARVIDFVNSHKEVQAFGGWYNSEDGQFYFDATVVFNSKSAALRFARINKQYAIYDLSKGENGEIRL